MQNNIHEISTWKRNYVIISDVQSGGFSFLIDLPVIVGPRRPDRFLPSSDDSDFGYVWLNRID